MMIHTHTIDQYVIVTAHQGLCFKYIAYSDATFYTTDNLNNAYKFYHKKEAVEIQNRYYKNSLVFKIVSTTLEMQ